MKQRGRKSAAALAIRTPSVELVPRPDAPYDLTDEEAAEWWAIVNRMPADYFPRETHPTLAQLCRHIVNARRIAQLIAQWMTPAKPGEPERDLAEYAAYLKLQERESRVIASLSTKLRLTQQANIRTDQARKPSSVPKPWDRRDERD